MELWGIAFYAVALYILLLRYLCGSHYNFSRTLFISPSTCCFIVLCANSFYAYINGYLIKEGIFQSKKMYEITVPQFFILGTYFSA